MKNYSKLLFLLMMFLFLTNNIFSQQITFSKVYNYDTTSVAYSVQQTIDTGYIVAGKINKKNGEVWILKLNKYGDTLWTKTYGDSLADYANEIQNTSDGGYIVAGGKNHKVDMVNYYMYGDIWILKLDQNGDTLWTKTYGGPYNDDANSIKQTSDGGYIVAGVKNNYQINYLGDIWILKLDQNGDTLWTRTYHFSNYLSEATSIIETKEGAYVFTGATSIGMLSSASIVAFKLSNTGDSLWCNNIVGYKGNDIIQTPDSCFILVGRGNQRDVTIKLNKFGNILWENDYLPHLGFYFQSNSVTLNSFGDIITAGQVNNNNDINIPNDLWIKKNLSNGDTVLTKIYNLSLYDKGYSIKTTNDNGYVIAGTTNNYAWLFKLNGNFDTITNIQENVHDTYKTWNYPNPFSNSTSIYYQISIKDYKKLEIKIFNSTGINLQTIIPDKFDENRVLIETTNLPSGVYYYTISTDFFSICKT